MGHGCEQPDRRLLVGQRRVLDGRLEVEVDAHVIGQRVEQVIEQQRAPMPCGS